MLIGGDDGGGCGGGGGGLLGSDVAIRHLCGSARGSEWQLDWRETKRERYKAREREREREREEKNGGRVWGRLYRVGVVGGGREHVADNGWLMPRRMVGLVRLDDAEIICQSQSANAKIEQNTKSERGRFIKRA